VALAIPVVSSEAQIMMSFSSLQKQRVGSNQPLGMAFGVFMVIPAYIIPLVFPALALTIDLLLASAIAVLSVTLYLSSSRLISREKLLP
jgi:type III secretory pathway component EscV